MAQYTLNPPLGEGDLQADPLAQFADWFTAAQAAGLLEPEAMTLATATPNGRPSARIVLFKGLSGEGLRFFTGYESRKGEELAANPFAALVFWWDKLERQVRFEGRVEKLSREESLAYFRSRPRESQISAYSSRQSQVVERRDALEHRVSENEARFAGRAVPLPEHWGGYRLLPDVVEFWQGRAGRLHDRLRYRREAARWCVERLEP